MRPWRRRVSSGVRAWAFGNGCCRQEKDDPHNVGPFERRLRQVVDRRDHEIRQSESAYPRVLAKHTDDVPVSSGHDDDEQSQSCPSQVQEDLKVAVVRLVRVPPVNPPELLDPLPEPEALEAGPEQRVGGKAQDLIPERSSTRERRVPSYCLDETYPGIEEQSREGKEQHGRHEKVHGRRPAGEPRQAHDAHQRTPDEETAEGGGGIGPPEEPQRHHENHAVSDQPPSSAAALATPQGLENAPHGCESEDQADVAETVLSRRDAAVI